MRISFCFMLIFLFMKTVKLSYSFQSCQENEKLALLDFKKGAIDMTNRLSSWVGDDCCNWKGVKCDNMTGHVVELDLRNPFPIDEDRLLDPSTDLHDLLYEQSCLTVVEVNPSLVELKHLSYLDLSWNNFSGIQIPNFFGSFPQLKYLNLSYACFGGLVPHHLGNLSSLRSIDLSNPSGYEELFPTLIVDSFHWTANLFSLQHLDMSGLDLSNIPADSFASLPSNLLDLRLSQCGLDPITLSDFQKNLTSLLILDLSDNAFHGPLPNFIRNMTLLNALDLSLNNFSSSFSLILDRLKNLNNLELFDMFTSQWRTTGAIPKKYLISESFFRGPLPPQVPREHSSLKVLLLGGNELTGSIPISLGNFSALEILDASQNELSGRVPESLGRLSALKTMRLHYNQLSGPIPMSLGSLTNLSILNLRSNRFNGTVPSTLGQLSKLSIMELSFNSLSGIVSEDTFSHLSQLESLDLSSNSLSFKATLGWVPPFQTTWINLGDCQIGPQFPDWLRTQTKLKYLNMSFAGISDSIPNWFNNISSHLRTLDISHNQIHGEIPNLLRSDVDYIRLSYNKFSGTLPPFPSNIYFLELSNNSISGPIPKDIDIMYPQLSSLYLYNNHINGSIPTSLCKLQYLMDLVLSKNQLSGDIPQCWNSPLLRILDFSFNDLSGVIPSSLGYSSKLVSLHLSNNALHGEIPSSLKNCTRLSILDLGENRLSGQIPAWIGEALSALRVLSLRSNNFSGEMLPKLCHLNDLHILEVSHNSLSGNIPQCFGNFSAMSSNQTDYFNGYTDNDNYPEQLLQVVKGKHRDYEKILRFLYNIDLSSNNFVGQIPEDLTTLSRLISLNLSNNQLVGSIPKNIGQMISLESLDFSQNNISGTIPQSISSLSKLSHLNLSYNHLSGQIPSGNQLQTLEDPSIYKENHELCGFPLLNKCLGDDPQDVPQYLDSELEDESDEKKWFWIGTATGIALGFWCVCGTLASKKTWRYAYFQCVDDIKDKLFAVVVITIACVKKKFMFHDVRK
ncbi:lysine--tRNA ligase [Ranunculus cassubicifolius]